MVVAQEVDGLAVLPGDGAQTSLAPEFVPATFSQPPAEFLEVVLGGNHALVEAELLVGAVVVAKEREHSVEHGPDFVNLVGLVHGLLRLIDQVQEAPEGDEAVAFHDFPETGGVRDEVVAGPLPVALIPGLDNALRPRKPKAEECFQLGDSDGLKILGVV